MLQQMRSAAKWIWLFVVITFVGGFLLLETSGLLGREQITPSTIVGSVNGVDIPYLTWANLANSMSQQREQASGQSLSLDDRRQIDDQAFEQLVTNVLLNQEYRRRGIRVSDQEILEAAQLSPPPELMQSPELQTDGQFDITKYQRLLKSPAARQQGLLVQLENYYRSEIPRAKLYDQIAGAVYISDARLWAMYQDANDSAQVSYVAFDPSAVPDSDISFTDAELHQYYDQHADQFKRPGRAVLSVLVIPRTITAADSAVVRDSILALRAQIEKGASFADLARQVSADTVSGRNGGELGMSAKGRFDPAFEDAAWKLRPGEVSRPVLTQYGYHLIRMNSRKADSIDVSHILLTIQQSDSSALKSDRTADTLAIIAGSSTEPQRFDSAAKHLRLTPETVQAYEDQPAFGASGALPGVSGWAFSGVQVGESSDLLESNAAYFLARLDSLQPGGTVPFSEAEQGIRVTLARRKRAEKLVPRAGKFAQAAAASGLDAAAKVEDITVHTTAMFARSTFVSGLGQLNEAIGAAFSLPVGRISEPIVTDDGVYVLRVDKRVEASHDAFEKQKDEQRKNAVNALRQARVRSYMEALRKNADVKDRRAQINAALRRQSTAAS